MPVKNDINVVYVCMCMHASLIYRVKHWYVCQQVRFRGALLSAPSAFSTVAVSGPRLPLPSLLLRLCIGGHCFLRWRGACHGEAH